MATIHDVARRAKVSPTTAKRAYREPELLAPATLERVLRAGEELDYEPDMVASALRSGHNKTVGLIIGSIVEPFFATLTRAIGKAVRTHGYTLIVADNEYGSELERQHLHHFHGNRVAGLILRSSFGASNVDYLERMQMHGTRIVEIDHHYPDSPFSRVMLDNEAAVDTGVRHLAELGHRRIAALGSYDERLRGLDERSRAFPAVMRRHGLAVDEAYRSANRPTEDEAHRTVRRLLDLPRPPSALFALTGSMAIGAYRALRECGLCIPDDISLLAYDDYPWTTLVEPGIDVLAQPVEEMGFAAVQLLFDAIAADRPEPRSQRFPARLIVRGSCARLTTVA